MDDKKSVLKEELPKVELPPSITVKQLADVLEVEPVKIIKQLMRKGIMANINQSLDFDTASTTVADFGYAAKAAKEPKALPSRKGKVKGKL